jgi:hypothetical protein
LLLGRIACHYRTARGTMQSAVSALANSPAIVTYVEIHDNVLS